MRFSPGSVLLVPLFALSLLLPLEIVAQERGLGDRVRSLFEKFDTNRDGKIDQAEYPGNQEGFMRLDSDGDGVITEGDLKESSSQPRSESRGRRRGQEGRPERGEPGKTEGRDRRGGMMAENWMRRFDLDHDGRVSSQEFDEASRKQFQTLDADGDGTVTREEVEKGLRKLMRGGQRSGREGRSRGGDENPLGRDDRPDRRSDRSKESDSAAMFKRMDKNGDGSISRDEFPRPEVFDRVDENGDGQVDQSEFEVIAKRFKGKGRGRKGAGRGEEGEGPSRRDRPREKHEEMETPESPREKKTDAMDFIRRHDLNGDGKVTRDEYSGPATTFDRHDTNGDDAVDDQD